MKQVLSNLGFTDFYAGIQAKLVQTVLYNAFLLIGYEKIRAAVRFIVLKSVRERRLLK